MKGYKVLLYFIALRILSVFVVKSWYVPDEYWQSLEVAHKITFGYGHLTWEWINGIRSYFHPLLIAGIYKILAILKYDEVCLLALVPRIFQALLTAYSDYRFFKFCGGTKWSIFFISSSWFIFYTGSRTLSNTLEMTLSTIALSYFPWKKYEESSAFLWPVALSVFIRPTAAIPWVPLCLYHLKTSNGKAIKLLLARYLPIGLIVGGAMVALDSYAHGKLIVTPWAFLKVNVFEEIGSFYGIHSWNWYFTVGLPTTLGITTLPFLFASVRAIRNRRVQPTQNILLVSILVTLVVYSLLPHKEFRFILPIVPMCLYICSDYMTQLSRNARTSSVLLWIIALVVFIGNVAPAGYLSAVHQKGTIDVMPHLARIAREYKDEAGNRANIMYLMPCHSTPYFSHIHANVTMRFLRCEPNLRKIDNYVDEAEQFYNEPMKWLRSHMPVYPRTSLPTHLVLFDVLVPKIEDFLTTYNPILTLFHSDFDAERVGRNVLVYERINPTEQKPPKTTPPPSQTPKVEKPTFRDDESL